MGIHKNDRIETKVTKKIFIFITQTNTVVKPVEGTRKNKMEID